MSWNDAETTEKPGMSLKEILQGQGLSPASSLSEYAREEPGEGWSGGFSR